MFFVLGSTPDTYHASVLVVFAHPRSIGCRAHLEIWTDFHRPLVSGMHASVHGGFGRFSPFFHVKADSDLVDMHDALEFLSSVHRQSFMTKLMWL